MRKAPKYVLQASMALLLAACAGASHVPIPDEQADRRSQGVRYYRHSLYLLVSSDGKGGLDTSFEYLPDPSKKMSICSYNFVASLDSKYTFSNGVLTDSDETPDSAKVPAAVIKAAASILPSLAALAKRAERQKWPEHVVPPPQIYKVVADGDRIHFIGKNVRIHDDGTMEPIKVSIVPKSPKNE